MSSLKHKLIITTISFCLIPCLFITGLVYYFTSVRFQDQIENELQSSLDIKTLWLDNWVFEVINATEAIAATSILLSEDDGEVQSYLREMQSRWNVRDIYFIEPSGVSRINTTRSQIVLEEDPVVAGALDGWDGFGGVTIDHERNPVIRYATPVFDGQQVVGALLTFKNLQDGANLITTESNLDTRENFIIAADGRILTSGRLGDEWRLSRLDTPPVEGFESGKGVARYTNHRGVEVIGAWNISQHGWVLVEEVEFDEVLAPLNGITRLILVTITLVIGLTALFSFFVSRGIANPIIQLAKSTTQISNGDLSITNMVALGERSKDEVGKLSSAFNNMLDNMRKLIGMVKSSTLSLELGSREIQQSASLLANEAGEQANIIQNITMATSDLAKTTERIADNSASARDAGSRALDIAVNSAQETRESINSFTEISDTVSQLRTYSKGISKIVGTIQEISEQTNLLALNASIEAARAGEHGKSFSVVAENISALAKKTGLSTKEINLLVTETSDKIQQAVEKTSTTAQQAQKAIASLDIIVNQIETVVQQVIDISDHCQAQASGAQEVSASMENLSATGQAVASSAQTMAQSAKDLNKLGNELKLLTQNFTNI